LGGEIPVLTLQVLFCEHSIRSTQTVVSSSHHWDLMLNGITYEIT
jgi:hypothetical protein